MVERSTGQIDDRQLVLRLMQKDERALAYFVELHGRPVCDSLTVKYRDVVDAQEMQAVMNAATLNVWRSASTFDPEKGSLRTWYYAIAQREVLNCIRENKIGKANWSPGFEPLIHARRPDDTSLSEAPLVKKLLAIVERLPRLQKSVVLADLAAGEKANDQRLAKLHNTTVSSIRASRSIARRRIREEMLEEESETEE